MMQSQSSAPRVERAPGFAIAQIVKPSFVCANEPDCILKWLTSGDNLRSIASYLNVDAHRYALHKPAGPTDRYIVLKARDNDEYLIIYTDVGALTHGAISSVLQVATEYPTAKAAWIAGEVTSDTREIINWLNVQTGRGYRFYGLELCFLQIGASLPAPRFDVVCTPEGQPRPTHRETTSSKALQRPSLPTSIERQHTLPPPASVSPSHKEARPVARPVEKVKARSGISARKRAKPTPPLPRKVPEPARRKVPDSTKAAGRRPTIVPASGATRSRPINAVAPQSALKPTIVSHATTTVSAANAVNEVEPRQAAAARRLPQLNIRIKLPSYHPGQTIKDWFDMAEPRQRLRNMRQHMTNKFTVESPQAIREFVSRLRQRLQKAETDSSRDESTPAPTDVVNLDFSSLAIVDDKPGDETKETNEFDFSMIDFWSGLNTAISQRSNVIGPQPAFPQPTITYPIGRTDRNRFIVAVDERSATLAVSLCIGGPLPPEVRPALIEAKHSFETSRGEKFTDQMVTEDGSAILRITRTGFDLSSKEVCASAQQWTAEIIDGICRAFAPLFGAQPARLSSDTHAAG